MKQTRAHKMHAVYTVFSTAVEMHNDVRSLGAALLRMTSLLAVDALGATALQASDVPSQHKPRFGWTAFWLWTESADI